MRKNLWVLLSLSFLFTAAQSRAATSYEKLVDQMKSMTQQESSLVSFVDFGKNNLGEVIYAIRIVPPGVSDISTLIPHVIVGAHHGDEVKSVDLAMSFANRIVKIFKDSKDPSFTTLAKDVFYIIPALNTNGYSRSKRCEVLKSTGGSGTTPSSCSKDGATPAGYEVVDPNRDYPDPCGPNKKNFQLQSTKSLADFLEKVRAVTAVTIHGYIGTFTYPWGTYAQNTHTSDHDFFAKMAEAAVKVNRYKTGTHADAIYPTVGAFEDWAYYQHGIYSMLVEMKSTADLNKDTEMMVQFYMLAPSERSKNHAQIGGCRTLEDEELDSPARRNDSRP